MAASTASPEGVTSKLAKEKTLRELLDGLVVSQRQDIHAYSKGHLNEANLVKPADISSRKTWRSATKPRVDIVPKSKLLQSRKDDSKHNTMKDTILNFSIGTAGNVQVKHGPVKPKPSPTSSKTLPTQASAGSTSTDKSRFSRKSDGVLIEELSVPEAMLARTQYYDPLSKLTRADGAVSTKDSEKPISRGSTEGQGLSATPATVPTHTHYDTLPPLAKHEFMPSYFNAVTKKDQLIKLRQFEEKVLRKQDAMEQNVMSGIKAAEHLEARLQQDLDSLSYSGYGPNFHRLQVYSNVFEDLIQESATFGFILETIKREYDEYIASLLDGQTAKHKVLFSQVEQLSAKGGNSETLKNEVHHVCFMEDEAKQLLEENENLRRELLEEEQLLNKPKEEEVPVKHPKKRQEEPAKDLTDQIEDMKVDILWKLDMMNDLKTKLRTEYVPSTVCSHLEQCIKETEVEIQKLTTQKEFFDRSISDMGTELQTAIETADTTEKDARRVWKRITAVNSIEMAQLNNSPGAGITTTGPGGNTNPFNDSDNEQDEQDKWNWYIS